MKPKKLFPEKSENEYAFSEEGMTDAMKRYLEEGFMQHAIEQVGLDGRKEMKAFLAHHNNQLIGIVVAAHFWGALHIKYVFISKEHRKKGLGRTLLEQALSFGRSLHCPFAFVETMSFQALSFYQKLGFSLDFTRSGFHQGISMHYASRSL